MNNKNQSAQLLANQLFNTYDLFKENSLKNRRFTQSDIIPLIQNLESNPIFEVSAIGKSFENRVIYQIKLGTGPTKVLLWSQMHGDEATATMAIFDIFNFFSEENDFESQKREILENCTLYFVPMLNPDGAERFIRRNALGIDLNRDALRLQSPEAVLLKKLQNELKPDFGFNLHDQSLRYAVGDTGKQTTMAFLATAYNVAREINPIRKRSMQLIVGMNRILQNFIPNQVARFSDEFEPRAFGDNIQKWGTTLILVESGGYTNDTEKQFIRKLNFVTLITSLLSIANIGYENESVDDYNSIPENTKSLFNLLIRNAIVSFDCKKITLDIGINTEEVPSKSAKKFLIKSTIEDLGDLSTFFGIEEIDASGMEFIAEKPLNLQQKADFKLVKDGKMEYLIKNGRIKR
jgi:Zinc carboxypeptidase